MESFYYEKKAFSFVEFFITFNLIKINLCCDENIERKRERKRIYVKALNIWFMNKFAKTLKISI